MRKRNEKSVCQTCVFFEFHEGKKSRNIGTCRRFPDFVTKKINDWCGEHPAFVLKRSRKIEQADEHPDFAAFWEVYPKRKGSNPRKTASVAFHKSVLVSPANEIIEGAYRYHNFCEQTGKIGTEFVPMASTWLNQHRWKDSVQSIEDSLPPMKNIEEKIMSEKLPF